MPIADWFDLMADTVSVAPWTGADAFGAPTYGSPVTYPAHIAGKIAMVRNLQGEEQVSTVTVYLGSATAGVKAEDLLVLPTRFQPQSPAIVSVAKVSDENGPHHEVLYCA